RRGDPVPFDFTLEHYAVVLRDQLPYLATSLVIGLGTVILTLAIAAPGAFAIARLRLPGGRVLSFALIVAQMVPAVVMSLGLYSIERQLGLRNTVPGLILADSTIVVPFAVMLLSAFMSGIPREMLQAVELDGASSWRTFRSVVLPVSRNALITASLFAFL